MEGNTVLMIIDVQTGMFDEKDPVANSETFTTTLQGLIVRARSSKLPVVYIQHMGGENSVLHPDKPGFPIYKKIAPEEGDLIIHKSHSDSFQDTELQAKLSKLNATKIIMAGIQTEYCVDTTCRRAYSLCYEVLLVKDGHTTWDSEHLTARQIINHHNETLGGSFAKLVLADDVLR